MDPEQNVFFEVETSRPDPQRGFPELWWKGKRPFRGVHYYPAQHKESHGPAVDGWRNQIYWGDNLQVMGHLLRRFRGQVNLVYIDPPFDSKADYKKTVRLRGRRVDSDVGAFEEIQYGDIWNNDEYLQFMYERLLLIRELMADRAAIFLHCDWHKSHHLRCLLDEVFAPGNFVNEIVWQRAGAHNDANRFGNIHDTLFFYRKGGSHTFNPAYVPLSDEHIEGRFNLTDEAGRRFFAGPITAPGPGPARRFRGTMIEPPPSRHWSYSQAKIDELESRNLIYYSRTGTPYLKQYMDDYVEQGRRVQSIWTDILPSKTGAELVGYPTQKPRGLLERVIASASEPGDLIFDCFMGSGTTQAVAMQLGRRFIGADINLFAIQATVSRLVKNTPPDTCGFDVFTVNHYDVFRNEHEARGLILEALGVRPLPRDSLWHGEDGEGNELRKVRVMPVNRITTRADLAPIVENLDYRELARRRAEAPNEPVERITLLCMGHEPGVAAELIEEIRSSLDDRGCEVDVEVVDILRSKEHIQFKRDSEVKITVEGQRLRIDRFYPMNLLQKLSMEKTAVFDWRELVDSVLIDFNYDGAVLRPSVLDIPGRGEQVAGVYDIPEGAGIIRVKITDVLADVLEASVEVGRG